MFEGYVDDFSTVIENNGQSVGNINLFRGIPIKYFRSYGINSIDELDCLNDKHLFDKCFVSFSLVDDDSSFVRDLTYKNESEYLIDTWNLA